MSAAEEYRTALEYAASHDVCLTSVAVEILADAAIAELEAEVKKLRHFNQLAIDLDATKTARIVELEAGRG